MYSKRKHRQVRKTIRLGRSKESHFRVWWDQKKRASANHVACTRYSRKRPFFTQQWSDAPYHRT